MGQGCFQGSPVKPGKMRDGNLGNNRLIFKGCKYHSEIIIFFMGLDCSEIITGGGGSG